MLQTTKPAAACHAETHQEPSVNVHIKQQNVGMVCGATWAGLNISGIVYLLGFA